MTRPPFQPGQRWASDAERDLGLGEILEVDERLVVVAFPGAGLQRQYALKQAPLTRIIFAPGDVVLDREGRHLTVLEAVENEGFLVYRCRSEQGETITLPETRLSGAMQIGRPQDRLFGGTVDPEKWFQLRRLTLSIKSHLQQSPVQGLIGSRVELIPHQLYIASEVGKRHAPRVLLADEVGLGKTIEAGLILHRQLLSGQITRVLILLPEALVHQWLVEMLRRFNLKFNLFDEQRCLQTPETNPFETSQLVIASLDFFMDSEERRQQALEAGWDMLIVDEAHHLRWSEPSPSAEYRFVEQLASLTPALLLLTATPEQLGVSSHFARLRLLDPARFHSLEAFLEEENNYQPVAMAASALIDARPLTGEQIHWLKKALPDYHRAIEQLDGKAADETTREQIIQALLDRHGAGRVLYRNTRNAIHGFPERRLRLVKLDCPAQYADCRRGVPALKPELSWRAAGSSQSWTAFDPRVDWLRVLIQANPEEKFLVICADANTSIELEQELRVRQAIRSAAFHEYLNMVARDRAAAWFADPDENAQCLICSEIGSEGRNFQFCHHLVLFDLPPVPDLLEQRIGRLDRIGQQHRIHIHVPVLKDTAQEQLADWYHQGLNAFEKTCPTGSSVYQQVEPDLLSVLQGQGDADGLIRKTRQLDKSLRQRLQAGRDKLLELGSYRADIGEAVVRDLQAAEKPAQLMAYLEQVCDCYNIRLGDQAANIYRLQPGNHMRTAHFPALNDEGFAFTPERSLGISREDLQFMTWEHPLVSGAIDLILSDDTGSAAVAVVDTDALPAGSLVLETIHVLEAVAPAELALHRFLPLTTLRVLTGARGEDLSESLKNVTLAAIPDKIPQESLKRFVSGQQNAIKSAIAASTAVAAQRASSSIEKALQNMRATLDFEQQRLTELRRRNRYIRQQEIDFIAAQKRQLTDIIRQAATRLDAVRLIVVRGRPD